MEEEEEADFPRTKWPKRRRICITHLWSNVHDHLAELFIIRWESLVLLLQGHELLRLDARIVVARPKLLRLDARYWLRAPNGWDTTGHLQVIGRSVGEPEHQIFIGSTRWSYLHPQIRIEIRMGRMIIPISLPQPTIIGILKMKKEIHIQFKKIITYKIKWLNEHTMKCWARLSTNCCIPFWRSSLRTCVSTNSSIGLGSRPRSVACKKKN